MSIYKYSVFMLLILLLIGGCSKKKEEAAKLEQEILGQEAARDTTGDTVSAMAVAYDSAADIGDASAIPEEEPARAIPTQPSGPGYVVQVASCESRDYAEYLVDKYISRGYEPFMTTVTHNGQTYYRVRIGLFENLEDALALKDELKSKYSAKPWVDKVGF